MAYSAITLAQHCFKRRQLASFSWSFDCRIDCPFHAGKNLHDLCILPRVTLLKSRQCKLPNPNILVAFRAHSNAICTARRLILQSEGAHMAPRMSDSFTRSLLASRKPGSCQSKIFQWVCSFIRLWAIADCFLGAVVQLRLNNT